MYCATAITDFVTYLDKNKSKCPFVIGRPKEDNDHRRYIVPSGLNYFTMVGFDLSQQRWIVSWCDQYGKMIPSSEIPTACSIIDGSDAYEQILNKIWDHPKNHSVCIQDTITRFSDYVEQNTKTYSLVIFNSPKSNDNCIYLLPLSHDCFTEVKFYFHKKQWIVTWCDCFMNVLLASYEIPNPCAIIPNDANAYEQILKKIMNHPKNK